MQSTTIEYNLLDFLEFTASDDSEATDGIRTQEPDSDDWLPQAFAA